MPAKPINTQYKIPQQRGGLNTYHAADDLQLTLQAVPNQHSQTYSRDVNTARAIASSSVNHVSSPSSHPTFTQVEPFLYEVGDWMTFNRNEVTGNGWVS